ncbi:imidazole glycerol phosphate synthase subunit HisH [Natroniella sulfidigena]|uniref:imidazole glycerol phosphate synthase subunit HisH n=1 Tax=Natroniella sulfidigena TaxID=723921 RepID=UPI00200B0E9C|nr:imidazole glycerol phosphate synthase subunit HisH [Natroniella sulfidigena]MCK8818182.1 imidazole glycerol phosphate synthase subunit HisH [Natroniella sulfidigena]
MIKIIDYGMGNLKNVQKAFEMVGYQAEVTQDKEEILAADGVVLPGVGAFKDAMENLEQLELIEVIKAVIEQGTPFLGICLGLQLLFTASEEFGVTEGLDIIPGRVKRFPQDLELKIPHIGWNQLNLKQETELYDYIEAGEYQYFVHSYYVEPDDKAVIATTTGYGIEFVSSIVKDNIYAVQFHPEKSSHKGLQLLKNFGKIVKGKE